MEIADERLIDRLKLINGKHTDDRVSFEQKLEELSDLKTGHWSWYTFPSSAVMTKPEYQMKSDDWNLIIQFNGLNENVEKLIKKYCLICKTVIKNIIINNVDIAHVMGADIKKKIKPNTDQKKDITKFLASVFGFYVCTYLNQELNIFSDFFKLVYNICYYCNIRDITWVVNDFIDETINDTISIISNSDITPDILNHLNDTLIEPNFDTSNIKFIDLDQEITELNKEFYIIFEKKGYKVDYSNKKFKITKNILDNRQNKCKISKKTKFIQCNKSSCKNILEEKYIELEQNPNNLIICLIFNI